MRNAHAFERQLADIPFFEEDEAFGAAGQRQRIRGEEILTVAEANDERRTLPRAHHRMRLVLMQHGNRICTVQLLNRGAHGGEQIALIQAMHQMRDHFRVGLRNELVALAAQHLAQRFVVLNDAVVNERQRIARENRVRVVGDRRAVRGPTRMRDPRDPFEVSLAHLIVQIRHPGDAARPVWFAVGQHGDAA